MTLKIDNDKYYTTIKVANECWDKTIEAIGYENITDIIEPSCGNGAFYHYSKYKPNIGYDIEPECCYNRVYRADYLTTEINYLEGRLIIENPPYGRCMNMA